MFYVRLSFLVFTTATPDHEWLQYLFAFLTYRSLNPETNPDPKSPSPNERSLASWIANQRRNMYKYRRGTASAITKCKIDALLQVKDFPFQSSELIQPIPVGHISTRLEKHRENLHKLRLYKEQHGHCNVPSRDGQLGNWVHYIKQQYHLGTLDAELRISLEEIGLRWSHWERMYAELKAYQEQFGDCDVPERRGEDYPYKSLNRWVVTQRRNYRLSNISKEEIQKLNDIGFDWISPRRRKTGDQKNIRPASRKELRIHWLKLLRDYKEKHGHINIPRREKELSMWIQMKRKEYKAGKLNEEVKAQLDELGIEWTHWDSMFHKLEAFYEENGHFNVTKSDETYKGLASWVGTQRDKYKNRKMKEGEVTKLKELGFDFIHASACRGTTSKSHSDKIQEHMEQLKAIRNAKAAQKTQNE